MGRCESPLEVLFKGWLAGLAGTLVLSFLMEQRARMSAERNPPPAPAEHPPTDPKERLVEKVSQGIFETDVTAGERATLAQALHWSYGAWWGGKYAMVQSTIRLPRVLSGLLLGLVVWAFGPNLALPAMKLTPPARTMPVPDQLASALIHVAYGVTIALVYGEIADGH